MNIAAYTAFLVPLVFAGGCAAPGPVDDGFELSQESVDIGRFLGDDALVVSLKIAIDEPEEE